MKFGNRQKGMGVGGWLLLILILGGGMTIGLKLVPVYMDHGTMVTVLTKLSEEDGMGAKRRDQIRDEVKRRLRLNNIREFNLNDHLLVERDREGTIVTLDYDVQIPLVRNLTLVADFNEQFRLRD